MIRITVYLRSGATLTFQAKDFTIDTNNGKCTGWTCEASEPRVWFDPTEVVAFASEKA